MKRCPTCDHVEKDETLKFCRLDGTSLVAAAAFESESAAMAGHWPYPAVTGLEHYFARAARCCKKKHKHMSYT
jgi:hypothetical protein